MFVRWFLALMLFGLAVLPGSAQVARGDRSTTPTLVVRIRSMERLLDDARYLVALAGREEEFKQLEELIKSHGGSIDTKRPLGLYGTLNANIMESTAVVLVPIADEKAFLDLLKRFNFSAKKGDNSIYTITGKNLPVPIYFRFANQYVYATAREKTALDWNKLLDPTMVLAVSRNETLSATLRIDQTPEVLKQGITSQVELATDTALRLADVKDQKQPGETEAQRKLRVQAAKETSRQLASLLVSVIQDGSELGLCLGVNRRTNDIFAELTLSAKLNSQLAESIAVLGPTPSLFGRLQSPNSAIEIFVHGLLDKLLMRFLGQLYLQWLSDVVDTVRKHNDLNKSVAREQLYAVAPMLAAEEFDFAGVVRGPTKNKHYAVLGGLRLKDGQGLEKVLRDIYQQLPKPDRDKIHFDAEAAGSVRIHRLDVQERFDEEDKRSFGDNPMYFAFRSDALFVTVGDGGLSLLKEAMAGKPGVTPPLKFNVSVARLVPLISYLQKADVQAIAQKAFGGTGKDNQKRQVIVGDRPLKPVPSPRRDKDNDKIRVIVVGGLTANVRVDMKANVIQFFSLLAKAIQPAD